MRDRDDRPGIFVEKPLEPRDRLRVQVVRRLIEQEQVGARQQEPAERDPTPFSAGERLHVGVPRRNP